MSQPVGDKPSLKRAWSGSPDHGLKYLRNGWSQSRQISCGCRLCQVL